jgi:hypothetical protein
VVNTAGRVADALQQNPDLTRRGFLGLNTEPPADSVQTSFGGARSDAFEERGGGALPPEPPPAPQEGGAAFQRDTSSTNPITGEPTQRPDTGAFDAQGSDE